MKHTPFTAIILPGFHTLQSLHWKRNLIHLIGISHFLLAHFIWLKCQQPTIINILIYINIHILLLLFAFSPMSKSQPLQFNLIGLLCSSTPSNVFNFSKGRDISFRSLSFIENRYVDWTSSIRLMIAKCSNWFCFKILINVNKGGFFHMRFLRDATLNVHYKTSNKFIHVEFNACGWTMNAKHQTNYASVRILLCFNPQSSLELFDVRYPGKYHIDNTQCIDCFMQTKKISITRR